MNGRVFVGSERGAVYALDTQTGKQKWVFDTGSRVASSPTGVGETVFVGSDDSNIYALDARTGQEKWRYETDGVVRSSPTVVNGTLFVGSYDGRVYALHAGVEGSSEGSRVALGTLGHHHEWDGTMPPN